MDSSRSIIIRKGSVSVEISNSVSAELLLSRIGEIFHAEMMLLGFAGSTWLPVTQMQGRGMEGLASIIKFNFQLDPYQKDILFLFCGRRTDRIKGLVWEGDGFLLLYKRLELGAFNWPRTKEEALEVAPNSTSISCRDLKLLRHPFKSQTGESLINPVQNRENKNIL